MGSVGKEKSGAGLAVAELTNIAPATSENKSARTSAFVNFVLLERTNSFSLLNIGLFYCKSIFVKKV
jgi:hypothetical protein